MSDRRGEVFHAARLDGAAPDEVLERRAVAMRDHGQGIALLDDVLRHALPHQADADKAHAQGGASALAVWSWLVSDLDGVRSG